MSIIVKSYNSSDLNLNKETFIDDKQNDKQNVYLKGKDIASALGIKIPKMLW